MKFLCACGSGLGSSLIISMNVSKVFSTLNLTNCEVEHCDISSVVSKDTDYYIFSLDVAESMAVSSIPKEKIIVLNNILSLPELTEKIQVVLNKI
ncbi:MAG: PTS sugar transporter subunit IIB [Brevinema sp.]